MIYLEPNTIFDGRYRLNEMLGQGASAQVWLAEDTLTNNLRVAVKVFTAACADFDSYGAKDFQKEFTTVYNINHQNLLTPTNYSVTDGVPYLVLPYCENGSVSSMVGRCDESDVVRLLHDVAAGLEHLHRHNVIHQDIKPDNIMLDDDLNYLLSDFGISTGRNSEAASFGGTRAYMAPERFNGVSDGKGDIWALGATAYEMLTGNAPFGDHGGLVQAQGEPIPSIDRTDLSAGLLSIINEMLDADPDKRPTPEQVRRRTALYIETGSWKVKQAGARTLKVGAIVLTLIAVVAGFFVWGMLRTKTYYYRDYVEVKGVPVGIGALYGSEQRARNVSYRIMTRGGKVTRLSLVNGKGRIVEYQDAEELGVRFPDQEYFYGSNDEIDYMIARDSHGKVLYKFSYDDKGANVAIQYDDENNSPKFYNGTVRQFDINTSNVSSSSIAHMHLTYDKHNRLVKRTFLSLYKHPTPDANGAFGQQYEYDDQGRVTEVIAIDRDGNPVGDSNGTSIRRYKYDDEGNRIEAAFFAADGNPSHEGNNIHIARFEYDDVGNMIAEMYFNGADEPVASSKSGVSGYQYEYDDHGFRTRTICVDGDGEPVFNRSGYVAEVYQPDENNFIAQMQFVDDDDNPVIAHYYGNRISGIKYSNNSTGLPLETTFLDENGEQTDNNRNISSFRYTYNETGDVLSLETLRIDGTPVGPNGNDSRIVYEYDRLGRSVSVSFFDSDDNPVVDTLNVHKVELTYSRDGGSVEKIQNFGVDGELANNRNGIATRAISYDDQGRCSEEAFFDASGKRIMVGPFSRLVYAYDPTISRINQTQYYDDKNKLLYTNHATYDLATGRIATDWVVLPTGMLKPNTAKMHYSYNDLGFIISTKATDLSDKPIEVPLSDDNVSAVAHELRNVYDNSGNVIDVSIWSSSSKPAASSYGVHRIVYEYDNRNRIVHKIHYATNNQPARKDGDIELTYRYDNRGNTVEVAVFNGYGRPVNTKVGYHKMVSEFDNHNNRISDKYLDVDGKPADGKPTAGNSVHGICSVKYEYDDFGNQTRVNFYDKSGKRVYSVKQTFNKFKVLTRLEILDSDNKTTDKIYGFAEAVVTTTPDGYFPVSQCLKSAQGNVLLTLYYNRSNGEWENAPVANAASTSSTQKQPAQNANQNSSQSVRRTSSQSSGDTSWMPDMKRQAAACPREIDNGIVMRSIEVSATSVTITIANKNISGTNYDRAELAQFARDYTNYPHDYFNVPQSVKCRVVIYNRQNQKIYPF